MDLSEFSHVPVIDVGPLVNGTAERAGLQRKSEPPAASAASSTSSATASMSHCAGNWKSIEPPVLRPGAKRRRCRSRWRAAAGRGAATFPVGDELTSGKPDQKEGIYFGAELPHDHPAVLAGTPLHGRICFPAIPGFRETVLGYIDALTRLGHALMSGDRAEPRSRRELLPRPLHRRSAHPVPHLQLSVRRAVANGDTPWGVGEHTDYGLLTILRQDDAGGLQVKSRSRWIDAPPIPGSFICNIGDMLDRLTARHLPLDAAPRPQHVAARPAVVPVLLRPELRRPDAADRGARGARGRADDPRTLGPRQRPRRSRAPTATTCSTRSPRCSRNCVGTCCRRTPSQAATCRRERAGRPGSPGRAPAAR